MEGSLGTATRRAVLKSVLAAGTAAACAPAAPQAAGTTEGAPAAGNAGWEKAWEGLVAAAKQEGNLVLATGPGDGYRTAVQAFEGAFPGIAVEHTQLQLANLRPRIVQERQAGIYAFDALCSNFGPQGTDLLATGAGVPLRPAIIRTDVLEDRLWQGGFDDGFLDKEKQYVYAIAQEVNRYLYINTDMVAESEIKSVQDLLDPRWKGKILSGDPRVIATGSYPASHLRQAHGDQILKRLWKDQEVVLSRDARQSTERMVRGAFPIGIGAVDRRVIKDFLREGLGKNLKVLDIEGFSTLGYTEDLYLIDRAPHPNAAKLFINWVLTKEGASTWAKLTETNSRRTDVPVADAETLPVPGRKYPINKQELIERDEETRKLAQQLLN